MAEALVVGLPVLQSLVLGSAVDDRPAALLPLLQAGALPQLTEVICDANCWNRTLSRAAFAGQLRRFSLSHGFGKGGAFELVGGPMSALRRLRLVEWQLQDCSAEWPVVLSHLRSLRTLEMENTACAEHLLDAPDCVPSLRELRYELRYYPQGRVAKVPPSVQSAGSAAGAAVAAARGAVCHTARVQLPTSAQCWR